MLGISARDERPAKLLLKPSNNRSISCCNIASGFASVRVRELSRPTGMSDFVAMIDPPKQWPLSGPIVISSRVSWNVLIEVKQGWPLHCNECPRYFPS
jgi:hypothetical protein